jgi:CHAT domain-containing protein
MVSSYVPSLSSLITARQNFTPILPQQLKAILVAERNAPGLPELEDVEREVQTVADLVASTSTTTANIALYSATVSTVLDGILEAHILHLACHGHQDTDPLRSHFSLRDGSLDIAELMKHELSNATFAFLSACETAKGDRNQPDQAVHLAASMLFCGFRSVIATMW